MKIESMRLLAKLVNQINRQVPLEKIDQVLIMHQINTEEKFEALIEEILRMDNDGTLQKQTSKNIMNLTARISKMDK